MNIFIYQQNQNSSQNYMWSNVRKTENVFYISIELHIEEPYLCGWLNILGGIFIYLFAEG